MVVGGCRSKTFWGGPFGGFSFRAGGGFSGIIFFVVFIQIDSFGFQAVFDAVGVLSWSLGSAVGFIIHEKVDLFHSILVLVTLPEQVESGLCFVKLLGVVDAFHLHWRAHGPEDSKHALRAEEGRCDGLCFAVGRGDMSFCEPLWGNLAGVG